MDATGLGLTSLADMGAVIRSATVSIVLPFILLSDPGDSACAS